MLRVIAHANGRRVYVASYRLHHGAAGLGVIAASYRWRRRAIGRAAIGAGLIMFAHDIRDFPFRDHCNH